MVDPFDQVNVGDHETIEIPVVKAFDDESLFFPREVGVARAKMAVTQFLAVERAFSQVGAVMKHRVQKTPNAPAFWV